MTPEQITLFARSVIETEASMITKLVDRIDASFNQACQILLAVRGRIVVLGVGKSGHIAKKIAATFASTGSPAFFVHPSEAKHGDIGMLTSSDVVIAISNSGESEEILAILPIIQRLNIPLVSLTGKPHSTLAKNAIVNLNVSVEKEACPLGLAPTASTTAALVMGDALAMTLLKLRGFTKQDFALSHPGGSLGRRLLLKVNEIMHKEHQVPIVSELASLKEALLEITKKKLGMTTVITPQGTLKGIFTDGDLRRALDSNVSLHQTPISEVMSPHPKTIGPDLLAAEALSIMEHHQITALVITNSSKEPIGVLHIHDILRAGID